ncbi:SulP family inorganic anion transporter [Stakelama marina]|uniref:SulP family inorganic anion transporter n=1 Tax=Stakelama marina TaxID=2826939 RepID=A0A8T4IAV0_9SPHN|nr:SulP family inorganic anion transporter [Stakelama marina]MBR0552148.1 SulP family inorganic anion transporter [Stakelama marina]
MSFASNVRRDWLTNPGREFLSGLMVALALIPEAIGFSIVAGVDPSVGLYASFSIACIIAVTGGRPGMISAATAAVAVLVGPLVRGHGVEYLFAATILMGVFQVIAGVLRLNLLMRFVSRSVITGFVNALAILIFMAQLPQLIGVPWVTYVLVAVTLAIIYGFPRITTALPAPLVAVVLVAAYTMISGTHVNTVGDMGDLPSTLPMFHLPAVPMTWETLRIIAPYSLGMAAVGLLETMLTSAIVDDMTETRSDKRRECMGQGVANFFTGFIGAMGGCAMIGQSVINIKSGGRRRLSTFVAGAMLLVLMVALGPWVARVPMPALVGVMIFVSISTFRWKSFAEISHFPLPSTAVMLATVVTVVWTHNLSIGVLVGVLLSGIFFAGKVRRLVTMESHLTPDGKERRYVISGQIFFASVDRIVEEVRFREDVERIVIDLTHAHFWDISATGALDKVVLRLRGEGKDVEVIGLNEASATLVEKFGEHDKPFQSLGVVGH